MAKINNSGLNTITAILKVIKEYVDSGISSAIKSIKVKGKTVIINEGVADLDLAASDISYDDTLTSLDADNVQTAIQNMGEKTPFKFGIDENGNYGYYKEGEEFITPFKSGGGGGETTPLGDVEKRVKMESGLISFIHTNNVSYAVEQITESFKVHDLGMYNISRFISEEVSCSVQQEG